MPGPPFLVVREGVCHVLFAFDIGREIDVVAAARLLGAQPEPPAAPGRPPYLQFARAPVRCDVQAAAKVEGAEVADQATLVLYEFGAAVVGFHAEAVGELADLARVSRALTATDALDREAQRIVAATMERLGDAIQLARVADVVEDYVVFHARRFESNVPPGEWTRAFPAELAAVLRGELGHLSSQEVERTLADSASYSPGDLTLVDWNAAFVARERADDLIAVLAFANVQLLEMRFLDQRLDHDLERSYHAVHESRRRLVVFPAGHRATLEQIARRQIDAALLFEHVRNAPKLLGDQYLARVYEHVSGRFRLRDWDDAIHRKLDVLAKIYDRVHDRASRVRAEVLEWIIILLFAADMALALLR